MYKRLSEIIEYLVDNRGKNPPYYTEEGIPVIDTNLIGETIYPDVSNVQRYIDDTLYNEFIRCKSIKNDLLVTLVGNGCGNSCLCNDSQIIIQNAVGLRFRNAVNSIYAYYYFKQKEVKYWIKNLDRGSAQPNVKVSDLLRMKLLLPNYDNQVKIQRVLNNYDSLIENNNKRIKLLETMAEELYKEWFVRFRFPGYKNIKYKSSNLGKIPLNFKVAKIKKVIEYYIGGGWGSDNKTQEFSIGAYVVRGVDFPYVKVGNTSTCPYRYHKKLNYEVRQLKKNDIVLEISGGTSEQPVGRAIIVTEGVVEQLQKEFICASFCKLIRAKKDIISPMYLYYWLQYLYDTKIIEKFQLQSTGIINFKFEYFYNKCDVLLPPNELMKKFDDYIIPIKDEIDKLSYKNRLLTEMCDYLLPRLMSGKLSVENKNII